MLKKRLTAFLVIGMALALAASAQDKPADRPTDKPAGDTTKKERTHA